MMDSLYSAAQPDSCLIIRPPGKDDTADFPMGLDADFDGKVIRINAFARCGTDTAPSPLTLILIVNHNFDLGSLICSSRKLAPPGSGTW